MTSKFVVVDGSNIATEGRSSPSLAQLDEAVREFQQQFPDRQVIVVVDATFGHRIDPSERKAFDEAIAHGEIVSPPAGAIGRGDAFLLLIAERVTAQILSNDSFQEFHPDHPWLFDEGRLIGGTPVSGIGWIFTPRIPVRSPRTRARKTAAGESAARPVPRKDPRKASQTKTQASPTKRAPAKKAAKQKKATSKAPAKKTTKAARAPKAEVASKGKKASSSPGTAKKKAAKPITVTKATKTAKVAAKASKVPKKATAAEKRVTGPPSPRARRRSRGEADAGAEGATNDPFTFLEFVGEHPIGSRIEGKITSFTSHGAMVDVGQMHCYVPLKGLGVPAPTSAREVLERGETRTFVLVGLDVARRGAELALPAVATGRRSTRQRSR